MGDLSNSERAAAVGPGWGRSTDKVRVEVPGGEWRGANAFIAAHGSHGAEARQADPWAFLGGGGPAAEGSGEREDGRRGLEEMGASYYSGGKEGAAEDSDCRGGKEAGPGRCCSPRHPTHVEPSFIELNSIL